MFFSLEVVLGIAQKPRMEFTKNHREQSPGTRGLVGIRRIAPQLSSFSTVLCDAARHGSPTSDALAFTFVRISKGLCTVRCSIADAGQCKHVMGSLKLELETQLFPS